MGCLTKSELAVDKEIASLIPDLPSPQDLLPYLQQIHHNRQYTNFGPLASTFEKQLVELLRRVQQKEFSPALDINASLFSSATTALEIAIASLDLPPQSLVMLPSLTFPATATSVLRNNLKPLLVDVDTKSWQLTPEIAYQIAHDLPIKAVIPVATFGMPLDINAWDAFTLETGIKVIIDAAGAFPFQPLSKDCPVVFSFHATKNFGIGEGGGIFSTCLETTKNYKRLSNFGFHHGVIDKLGTNGKLSEYHAAVGLAQIKRWPEIQNKKSIIADYYNDALTEINSISLQEKPSQVAQYFPSLKVIKTHQEADKLVQSMHQKNIQCRRWYSPPLHQHPLFSPYQLKTSNKTYARLTATDVLSKHLIGLPFHSFLSKQDIDAVTRNLQSSISQLDKKP